MIKRLKKFLLAHPKWKKVAGATLVLWGIFALFTPFTPGAWLAFFGFELLGIELLFLEKIKAWWRKRKEPFVD